MSGEVTSGLRVYVQDVRDAGYCMRGARAWGKSKGWDWSDFLANGIPIERVEAMRDGMAANIAAHVRRREGVKKHGC